MKQTMNRAMEWFNRSHPVILPLSIFFILIEVVALTACLLMGYRFAIYENIRPDWEAIGTLFSFIASVGAISAAVIIPWRVAQQQNKIALFGIKHESYAEIHKLLCLADSISNYLFKKDNQDKMYVDQVFCEMKKPSIILNSMAVIFGFAYDEAETDKDIWILFISKLKETEYLIKKSLYLFDYINPEDVQQMTITCQNFLVYVLNMRNNPIKLASNGGDDSTGRAFISACHNFMEKYEERIDADLLM